MVNDLSSSWSKLSSNGAQGSKLGPLFLLCINDRPRSCDSMEILLFTDDTKLPVVGTDDPEVDGVFKKSYHRLNLNKFVLNIE